MLQLWSPKELQRDCIINDPSVTCGSLGKVAGSDGQELSDILERVKAAAEAKQAPEVSTPECHYRPIERARKKRKVRLALEESQRSHVLSAWEKERCVNRCVTCNYKFTDSHWSQFKSEGWEVELISHCNTCIDLMNVVS